MATKRIIRPNTQESDTITQSASNSGFKHIVCPEDNLENYLTPDGNVLCEKWFLKAYPFQCGFGRVLCQMEDGTAKWNFVTSSGEFLSENYFKYADDFVENFAVVSPEYLNRFNYLTTTGDFLLPDDVYNLKPFSEGYGLVQKDIHIFNFVRPDGSYLATLDYRDAESFHKGIALVSREDRSSVLHLRPIWNFIRSDGFYVSHDWFREKPIFGANDCALVQRVDDYCFSYLTAEGRFLCNDWFRGAEPFKDDYDYAVVNKDYYNQNLLKRDGTLLSKQWYRDVKEIYRGLVLVQDHHYYYNLILPNGKLFWKDFVSDTWFRKDRDGIAVLEGRDQKKYTFEELLRMGKETD